LYYTASGIITPIGMLYVQSSTPDDGRKDRPKHVECHSTVNKFDTLVHLVGFTIEGNSIVDCTE